MMRTVLFLLAILPAEKPPQGKALQKLVEEYLAANESRRTQMRVEADARYAPLGPGAGLEALRAEMLKYAAGFGRKISTQPGTHYFLDEKTKRGKYIVAGKPGKTLWIGLHGGGAGSGDAGSAAGSMGGGGWWWIFPEVLEKTEHGWTDSGSEEFVMDLVEAAKRSAKVDPNRIYITGHSMGGYGTWTLGAHHADVFAGGAAYAGAPSPYLRSPSDPTVVGIQDGVIPNWYNNPFFFFQSLDDVQVPPATNVFANQELKRWKERHPGGFNFRYVEVDKNGHAAPKEGYLPSQNWIASFERNARPKKILWQPTLGWKKQFYWLYWQESRHAALVQAEIKPGNEIELQALDGKELSRVTVLLGAPLIDLNKEIVVRVGGAEKFRGLVARTFSALLLTLPRNDAQLLFDAKVDL